jgi:hypothetical protein
LLSFTTRLASTTSLRGGEVPTHPVSAVESVVCMPVLPYLFRSRVPASTSKIKIMVLNCNLQGLSGSSLSQQASCVSDGNGSLSLSKSQKHGSCSLRLGRVSYLPTFRYQCRPIYMSRLSLSPFPFQSISHLPPATPAKARRFIPRPTARRRWRSRRPSTSSPKGRARRACSTVAVAVSEPV